eukprot:123129_1
MSLPNYLPQEIQIIHKRCNICHKKFKLSAKDQEAHIAGAHHKRALKRLRQRMSVKHSNSKPKVSQSTNDNTNLQNLRISIYLLVAGFINEIFARNERFTNWISIDITHLISSMYAKQVIMNIKYDKQMEYILYCPVNEKPIFILKLNVALKKFNHFSKKERPVQEILLIIEKYFQIPQQRKTIIHLILQSAMEGKTGSEYMNLLSYLFNVLKLKAFRKTVVEETNQLFEKHCINQKKKDKFIKIMSLIAELYNSEFISAKIVRKGIFVPLLSPQNINVQEIDVEGLCFLLKHCGAKLDKQAKKSVDKYLRILINDGKNMGLDTQELVEEIRWMRKHKWAYKHVPSHLKMKWRQAKRRQSTMQQDTRKQFWWHEDNQEIRM